MFALAGAKVALIERRPDPDAYTVVCTHQILSSAVPTIERLGLAPLIEAARRSAHPCRSVVAVWGLDALPDRRSLRLWRNALDA